ncbi:MAG: oxidoreductase [Chloroflexi bacterium]|nr:oxidoreductase [Chloroflexota bacterium]
MLTLITFTPALGAILLILLRGDARTTRFIALLTALVTLLLTLIIYFSYDTAQGGYQFVQRATWIEAFNIEYLVGIDGLSAPLILLNGILGLSAVLISWHISEKIHTYFMWLLLLQSAVMGVFVSLDLILFFVFWELELIPMFFLISSWGTGRREYSAMKFLIFTFLGSAFMFASILVLYFSYPELERTFDITVLAEKNLVNLLVPSSFVFMGFLVAFAVKLPIFPLHTWLPDAHTDAPTAVSVMLAGVLLKMGGYGLLRINAGLFPSELVSFAPVLATLAVINVLYGAFIVMRQNDLKRLVAYSSVSHMGFVVLGLASVSAVPGNLNAAGLNGAALQLFTHGTITGLLFVVVGLIYERTHTRNISDMSGIAKRVPLITVGFMIAGLASLGLPMTSGFVAEVLVFIGTFPAYQLATILTVTGVVLAAGYILWTAQRIFFGPITEKWDSLKDATPVDIAAMAILILPIFVIGIYPAIITEVFESGINPIFERFTF